MTATSVSGLDAQAYAKARAEALQPAPAPLPTVIVAPSDMTPEEHAEMVSARNPKRAGEMTAAEYGAARRDLIKRNRK